MERIRDSTYVNSIEIADIVIDDKDLVPLFFRIQFLLQEMIVKDRQNQQEHLRRRFRPTANHTLKLWQSKLPLVLGKLELSLPTGKLVWLKRFDHKELWRTYIQGIWGICQERLKP